MSGGTNREVIKAMVDVTADSGADAIMLDTRIQSKVARVSLMNTAADGLIDVNRYDVRGDLARTGILSLEELSFFVDYCHHRSVEANLAGSFQSYQAQQVWLQLPNVDQISTRGGSTAVAVNPYRRDEAADTRQFRVTQRNLVRGLVPPEQGGVLNVPDRMKQSMVDDGIADALRDMLNSEREKIGLGPAECYFVDRFGNQSPF